MNPTNLQALGSLIMLQSKLNVITAALGNAKHESDRVLPDSVLGMLAKQRNDLVALELTLGNEITWLRIMIEREDLDVNAEYRRRDLLEVRL